MELRHLRYFVAVAEELNFSRAADRLHIAQPPLSQQIQQLEAELGFALFNRSKRRVTLTEAGSAFLTQTRLVLQQVEQAVQIGQQASRGEVGRLAIGFVSSSAYNILPSILKTFHRQVPGVTLELRELTSQAQIQAVLAGQLDIGLVRPPVDTDALATQIIFREPLMVALPESHPLHQQDQIAVNDLAQEAFILFPRSVAPGLHDQILSVCLQAGFSPQVAQEAIQMQTIVSLVAAEMGVAIVPLSLQNLQRQGVVYKPLWEETPMVEIMVICRRQTTATVDRFLAVIQAVCSEMGDRTES